MSAIFLDLDIKVRICFWWTVKLCITFLNPTTLYLWFQFSKKTQLLVGNKFEGSRIHTVPQMRGCRTVVKDVAQV